MAHEIEADFPPNLTCLKNVDTLLRCPICFDYFNISMMTQCSHNFCSLCIRKFLSYKLLCPVCNTDMTEQDLRNNRLMDDLVSTFQEARQQLSKANVDSPPISPKTPGPAVKCKTPKRKGPKAGSSDVSDFFKKRQRKAHCEEVRNAECGKSQTLWAHNINDAHQDSGNGHFLLVVKKEPVEMMNESVPDLLSIKKEEPALHILNPAFDMAPSSSQQRNRHPIIKVECPACSVSVKEHYINNHLDTCLTRDAKKESLRSKGRRPMPKLVYTLLTTRELKRRLKDCHLSVQGSRDQLIRRHQDFVHIYNAQSDSLNPRSAQEIAKEVEVNEKIRNLLQKQSQPPMVFKKNQSEEEIDQIHTNYRKQHSSDFTRLVAQARGHLETNTQSCGKQQDADNKKKAQETQPADLIAETIIPVAEKAADNEFDRDQSGEVIDLSLSPASSNDVSISSSVSDIFGPETSECTEEMVATPVQKRSSNSRDTEHSSSPTPGKQQQNI